MQVKYALQLDGVVLNKNTGRSKKIVLTENTYNVLQGHTIN